MATNLEDQVDTWHGNRFGPSVNVPATYRKLLEEVGELGEAIMMQDGEACWEELGDVLLVLRHIQRATCGADRSMSLALGGALDKCERRGHKPKPVPEDGRVEK